MLTHESSPPSPPEAWPEIGIDERLTIWRNGDVIDVKHIPPSHSDTDLSISFSKADVLHMGDLWFNGIYPVIDEISGGSISGTIHEVEKVLAEVSASTKIIPGHGPVGGKDELQKFHAMLTGIRDKVAALKTQGLSEEAVIAQKPTAEFDATYKEEYMKIDALVGVVYRTL
jgi:glyoxylase-like metal-dependent hydrolase (beta-lactamase superfamily II)